MNGKYVPQKSELSFKQKWIIGSILIFNRHTLYGWDGFSEIRNDFGKLPLGLVNKLD